MVYGKKNIINSETRISIGMMEDRKVMAGHLNAVKALCKNYLNIKPGNVKKSDIAKKIQNYFLKNENSKNKKVGCFVVR